MNIGISISKLSGEIGGYPLTESGYNWYESIDDDIITDAIGVALSNGIYDEGEISEFRSTLIDYSDEDDIDAINEFIKSIGADGESMEPFCESPLYIGAVSYNDEGEFPIVCTDSNGDERELKLDIRVRNTLITNWYNKEAEIDQWWEDNELEVNAYVKEHNCSDMDAVVKLCPIKEEDNPKYSCYFLTAHAVAKGIWTGELPESVETVDDIDEDKFSCSLVGVSHDEDIYVSMGSIEYDGESIDLEEDSTGCEFNVHVIAE